MSEHQEQVAVFIWAELHQTTRPELALLHAIPNGGHRHKAVAIRLKAEGVKSGVPDIVWPLPRGRFHGLYLEMKYGKNKPSQNQKWWLGQLEKQGYSTTVCWGFEEAIDAIETYYSLGEFYHE